MMDELLTIRTTCRLCDSKHIVRSIPLARVPIVSPNVGTETDAAGQRLTRIVAPLDNYLCQDCGLIQLVHVVDPRLIYRNYLYRTAVSVGLPEHFRGLSEAVIARAELKPGDLVFFNTMRRAFSHVGIYVGEGKFIHAPRTGAQVRVEDLNGSYWQRRFDGARRVLAAQGQPKAE